MYGKSGNDPVGCKLKEKNKKSARVLVLYADFLIAFVLLICVTTL